MRRVEEALAESCCQIGKLECGERMPSLPETNSRAALTLALEQYQRGLVSYTTVLESQRQAFDAEATVVQLRNQLLQNRIALFLALGGSFSSGS